MKIAKALKLKNRLAGDIAVLKQRIMENNVSVDGRKRDFDVGDLATKLTVAIQSLVSVKTAIAVANGGATSEQGSCNARRIYAMAEAKGLIDMYRSLDTKNGKYKEGGGYGNPVVETEYTAHFTKANVDERVAALTDEIEVYQEAVDAFNATTDVKVD